MNWAHVHLILNHGPVVGALFAWVLLVAGMLWRSPDVLRAAMIAFVVVGVLAAVVVQTGERAEEQVEDLPGISENRVEEHEEAAEMAAIGLEILGALSLVGLIAFRSPRRLPRWFALVVLVAALAPMAATARTADLEGRIRHPENRPDATSGISDGEDHEDGESP
jgi:hypothetical protein